MVAPLRDATGARSHPSTAQDRWIRTRRPIPPGCGVAPSLRTPSPGFAAYVWVTKPDGKRTRKYVYRKTREAVHDKWIKLHQQAKAGRVVTRLPTLAGDLDSWLRDVVEPNLAPATAANYDMFVRLYIVPELGSRRLDKLAVRDIQAWLNGLRTACQCCLQGKDAARPEGSGSAAP